jgi:protein gp37
MSQTKIEWATHTVNPIRVKGPGKVWKYGYHCTKVSPGCTNCYSERLNIMRGTGLPYDNRKVEFYLDLSQFDELPKTKSSMVFIQSMGDLFHENISWNFIYKVFERMLIIDHHTYIVLTKRHDIMEKIMPGIWFQLKRNYPDKAFPLKNVIGMVTGENQEMIDLRVPALLRSPFSIRGISMEPMLGAVELMSPIGQDRRYLGRFICHECEDEPPGYECNCCMMNTKVTKVENRIDWVVLGAESGPKRRPHRQTDMYDVVKQCQDTGIPVFVKQIQAWDGKQYPKDLQ